MFSVDLKRAIASEIQEILKKTKHPELPDGEIQFLLHVDGKEDWSWANIRNNNPIQFDITGKLIGNITANITSKQTKYMDTNLFDLTCPKCQSVHNHIENYCSKCGTKLLEEV